MRLLASDIRRGDIIVRDGRSFYVTSTERCTMVDHTEIVLSESFESPR